MYTTENVYLENVYLENYKTLMKKVEDTNK